MMNWRRSLATLMTCCALASAGCATSEPASDLYTVVLEQGPPVDRTGRSIAGAKAASVIQVDEGLLRQDPARLRLALPGGRSVTATRDGDQRDAGYKSWLGTVSEDGQPAGHVHLLRHSNGVSARIELRDARYEIHTREGASSYLYTMDERWAPGCPVDARPPLAAAPAPRPQAQLKGLLAPAEEPGAVLDVVALYPASDYPADGPALERLRDFVNRSIDAANVVFDNSKVDARYRLVGLAPISGRPFAGVQDALAWLMEEPAEVRTIRDKHQADLVSLFLPMPEGPKAEPIYECGIGAAPIKDGSVFYGNNSYLVWKDQAFSVHREGCGLLDYTFAHEVGHNFSMFHKADDTREFGKFSFSTPAVDTDRNIATLMGCVKEPVGDFRKDWYCRRVPLLSGPDSFYDGVRMGDQLRDNARVARLQASIYARFRGGAAPQEDLPPVAKFGYQCAGLQCTLDGRASSDDRGIVSYAWQLPNQRTAQGALLPVFLPGYGRHEIRLVVTDTRGQSAQVTQTIDLAERAVTPRSGMYWDQDRPGTGFDLFRNATGEIALWWYTFDDARLPVWYHAAAAGSARGPASWSQELREYFWKSGDRRVGRVRLEFSDDSNAWLTWEPESGPRQATRLSYFRGQGARSAAWYDSTDQGWGLMLKEQGGEMLVTMAVYENGQPRWVQGSARSENDVTIPLIYLKGGACTFCPPGAAPQEIGAGAVRVQVSSGAQRGAAAFDITMPLGRMTRTLLPIEIQSR